MIKKVTIGFLGCGNVGSGVWRLLENFAGDIAHRAGLTFFVKKVLVRSLDKKRDITFPPGRIDHGPEDVLDDPGNRDGGRIPWWRRNPPIAICCTRLRTAKR